MLQLIKDQFNLTMSSKYLDDNKNIGKQEILSNENVSLHNSQLACLDGQPLALEKVCNLSAMDITTEMEYPVSSRIFDYYNFRAVKEQEIAKTFVEYGEGTLILLSDDDLNVDKRYLFALLPSESSRERQVLRIRPAEVPDMALSLRALQTQYMPFSLSVDCIFEATYEFNFSKYHIIFEQTKTDTLLSAPKNDVIGSLETEIFPYSTIASPLPKLKLDVDRVKQLCQAHLHEAAWETNTNFLIDSDGEIKANVVSCLNATTLSGNRNLDSTERIWEALKGSPDRKAARMGIQFALSYLQEHNSLVSIDRYNFTKLAQLLSLSTLSRPATHTQIDILGLQFLMEIGLFKVTNDCLSVIKSVYPNFDFASENFSVKINLDTRLMHLHHLFKMACFTVSLSNTIQKSTFQDQLRSLLMDTHLSESEWPSTINTNELDLDFVMRNKFDISVDHLLTQLNHLIPTIWIIRYSTTEPIQIEKRIVFECINTSDEKVFYVCHLMELTNTVWLYED